MEGKKEIRLKIDGTEVAVEEGKTVLEAAREAGVYIPTLCSHPDLPPFGACRLCICEIEGMKGYPTSCTVPAADGMVVTTDSARVRELRREVLSLLLEDHPHACLTCAQREGCTREPCSTNVPVEERCCPLLGNCELERVVAYVGIREDTPKYVPGEARIFEDDPLIHRDYNLCVLCGRCVSACEELRGIGVLGFINRGQEAQVSTSFDRPLLDSDCMFCTTCVEVCPTGALRDKDLGKGSREEVLVPCRSTCPAGLDVPRFIAHLREGELEEAGAVLWESLPLPGVLGYICPHPCEEQCRRGKVNEPVAIRELQRYVAENSEGAWWDPPADGGTGKRVAVVGSGPAGLSAAYFLAGKGHDVTVMEADGALGGWLRRAVPTYRLPREVLDREIAIIGERGVDFRTGKAVEEPEALLGDGYDAVLLATGAPDAGDPGIPGLGEDRPIGVLGAMELIVGYNNRQPRVADPVIVIGGGFPALEASRICRRLGAGEVRVLLPPGKVGALPPEERARAEEEGVAFVEDSEVEAVREAAGPDGGLAVELAGGEVLEAGNVIDAVVPAGNRALLKVDDRWRVKGKDGVFGAGEAVEAGIPAVEAVARGREAAGAVDEHLGGDGDLSLTLIQASSPDPRIDRIRDFGSLPGERPRELPVEDRLGGKGPECGALDPEAAAREAQRCLRCNLRLELSEVPPPPEEYLVLDEEHVAQVPDTEGVYTLLDDEGTVLAIKGVENLGSSLRDMLSDPGKATRFEYEEDKMYSKRENELLQRYMQVHGKMPEGAGGEDDLDDLF